MKRIQGECRLPRLFLFIVVAIYGVGDLTTTVLGIGITDIAAKETNPAMSWVLANFSIAAAITIIILIKIIIVITICGALSYLYREKFYLTAIASAVVLSVLGAAAVASNIFVISGLAVITIDKVLMAALPIILSTAMLPPFGIELFLKKKYCY